MKKTTAIQKMLNVIKYLAAQRMALGYDELQQERWNALMDAQRILASRLFDLLKS